MHSKSSSNRKKIATGFNIILLHEFEFLERHRAFVEKHFIQAEKDFNQRFDKEISSIQEDEERAAYADHMSEEYVSVVETLPRLQWYSQFLVVYSLFEYTLNRLCEIVKNRSGFELSVKDLAGQGIRRAANYLQKVAFVEKPFQSAEWHTALLLGEVRNAIAHRNGEIEYEVSNKGSLACRAQSLPGLELKQLAKGDSDAEIVIGPGFVRDAIISLRKVLNDVANYELYDIED